MAKSKDRVQIDPDDEDFQFTIFLLKNHRFVKMHGTKKAWKYFKHLKKFKLDE